MSLVSMRVRELKGLNLGEDSLHLGIHNCIGLIGGREFGYTLGDGGCAFVLVYLEARHNLIYDGVGVVKSKIVNCAAGFPEFKVSFSEVVLEVVTCFVLWIGAFLRPDIVFEDLLSVEDNGGKVYCLTLG